MTPIVLLVIIYLYIELCIWSDNGISRIFDEIDGAQE